MKTVKNGRATSIFALVVAGLCAALLSAALPATAADPVNVTQHHNHDSRDGLFVDPAFTAAAAATVTRDLSFNGTIAGNVYAQPLYIENGPGGAAMVIAVTESNNVYALNAATGSIIWQRNVGTPITSGLPCGNINPLGITGTPIVDLASRSLFFDAETTPTAGTFKHLIYLPERRYGCHQRRLAGGRECRGIGLCIHLCKVNEPRSASWVTFFMYRMADASATAEVIAAGSSACR